MLKSEKVRINGALFCGKITVKFNENQNKKWRKIVIVAQVQVDEKCGILCKNDGGFEGENSCFFRRCREVKNDRIWLLLYI